MLPFFGPSTLRDGLGLAVDSQARPQSILWITKMVCIGQPTSYKLLIHVPSI